MIQRILGTLLVALFSLSASQGPVCAAEDESIAASAPKSEQVSTVRSDAERQNGESQDVSLDDSGVVYLYRTSAFYGVLQSFDVFVNDKKIGELSNGSNLRIVLKPGSFRFRVSPGWGAKSSEKLVRVIQGDISHYQYDFATGPLANSFFIGSSIESRSSEQAKQDEAGLKEISLEVATQVPFLEMLLDGAPDTAAKIGFHRYVGPRETGWATVEDIDAVPVREEGKDRFRHYLTLRPPKVFVVLSTGGWRFWSNDPESIAKGLQFCSQQQNPCWLYAVDDRVVWHPDISKRIGKPEQVTLAQ